MACDHSALHSGEARYLREAGQLVLVVVCDSCGAVQVEVDRIDYAPNARCFAGHLAELTARELGLGETDVARVRFAALVCGLARDEIEPEILNKQGPLTRSERAEVCRQPEFGAALISDASFDDLREWILCHRERPDGSGYPRGLRGEEIPVEARILAVTDAYVAMTSDRPYRMARDHEEACLELTRCAGSQFDPAVVAAFLVASRRRNPRLVRAHLASSHLMSAAA
jgi:HD-GYP domain-containing protein (c-di-GMP phosphodiesterase class II)